MALRLALRTLRKTPFVTAIAILSLALGIGANTAIYSVFDQMLRRPLPVPEPHRLVNLAAPPPKPGSTSCNQAGDCDQVFSYAMFRDLERDQSVFEGMAAHFLTGVNIATRGQTLSREGVLVSGSYFPTLKLTPTLGRLLGPGDDGPSGSPLVAVLSHAFWTTYLGADPHVLSQPFTINGQAITIVGVGPVGFEGTTLGARASVFLPISLRDLLLPGARTSTFENRRSYWAYLFARLKPGISIEQARSALQPLYSRVLNEVEAPLQQGMSDATMARFRARPLVMEPGERGQTSVAADARSGLILLLGVTGFVLLIACANIANLLLARSAARAAEMSIRLSIGASRAQLIRQLMTESLLLAGLGGVTGLLVARWTLYLMMTILPSEVQNNIQFHLDWSVLPVAAAVTLATGVLFGLFPALYSTRPDLVSIIKSQAGQPGGGRSASRFRTSLATTQIALSMALLVAAGLFTKSLINASKVNLGLRTENILMFRIAPLLNGYSPVRSRQLYEQLNDALSSLPGVLSASQATIPLLSGNNNNNSLIVEGFEAGPDTDTTARVNRVGNDYFTLLDIPLLSGRAFTDADVIDAPKVAIVNEAFLKKFNLGTDAVGRHLGQRDGQNKLDVEIVGVVRNAKYSEVKQDMPVVYFTPYRQYEPGFMTFYVRTGNAPESMTASVRKAVAGIDPNLPVDDVRTLSQQVQDNIFLDRFIGVLATAFASLATLLAAIGLYGVLAYTVSLRTRELGLRMALGAAPARVRNMVLGQVAKMLAIGGVIGMLAAVWIGSIASSMLFQTQSWDPVVLVGAAISLSAVAMLAGFLPARRAARIHPMVALRYE